MTREEAIKIVSGVTEFAWDSPHGLLIDRLVALGLLKLEETIRPPKMEAVAIAMTISGDSRKFCDVLSKFGYEVVEKQAWRMR